VNDGLSPARNLLPGVRLDIVEVLDGGERTDVRRVRACWPEADDTSVVVKNFVSAGEGWAREAAALAMLAPQAPAPRLIAEGIAPPLVVMSDVGTGPSLADLLLASDFNAAADGVLAWAESLAALHSSTLGRRDEFRAQLALRSGDLPIADHSMPAAVDEAAVLLEAHSAALGVTIPSRALSQLRELPRRLRADDDTAALSPSDACPSDNVRTPDGVVLVDFEGAQWRHVAWDVAYLTVPWPSCWCSWRMPADIVERAVERYRARIEDRLPYVRTQDFRHDVATAAIGWAFVSTALFMPNALSADTPPEDRRKVTPTRRAMILHRLDRARRHDDLEALAEFADRLRQALVARWGEVPLAYAPAFEQPD
jgi:hypothetical protein